MPALAGHLNANKYQLQNAVAHSTTPAPSSPVEGQFYFDNQAGNKTLYFWDGTQWVSAKSGAPSGSAGGDLAGSYPNPTIGLLKITDAHVNASAAIAKSKLAALNIVNADVAAGAAIAYSKLALTGLIANADIAAAAGIPYSKLSLATSIVNADIAVAAAIAYSKLALTNSIVNGDINASAAIAWSKINSAGLVVNADIGAAAAIAYSKLALSNSITNADLAGSIALSKLATDPLARANHTGSQLASTISNFDTQVRTSTLAQMAAPAGPVAFNNQKITGLADGAAAQDAVTKQQLDSVVTGLDVKASVRAASTGNVTLPPGGTALVMDGVTLANTERVLLKDQTTPSQNGIYTVSGVGTSVVLTRSTDADTSAEVTAGLFTFVSEGTLNADSGWYLQTNNPITLNTTGLVFVQFSGAGQITDGAGLLKTGNVLDVRVDGSSIEISADVLRVKALGVTAAMLAAASVNLATTTVTGTLPVANGGTGQTAAKAARETGLAAAGYYSSATHGAGTTISITQATHLLRASRGLLVQVQEEATGLVVLPDVVVAANGDITITFGASVTANSYRTTVIG